MNTNPVSVDENLARIRLGNDTGQDICKILGTEFFQKLHNGHLRGTSGNVCHKC